MKRLTLTGLILCSLSLSAQLSLAGNQTINLSQNQTAANQSQQKSWLGVWIDSVPAAVGTHLPGQLKQNQGVMVKKISKISPAFKAGLKKYDIIARFNDQEIYSKEQLTSLVRATPLNTRVTLGVIQQGHWVDVDVVLTPAPAHTAQRKRAPQPGTPFARHPFPPSFQQMLPDWDDPFFNTPPFDPNMGFGPNNMMPPSQFQQQTQQNSWSRFESIQIESKGNDQHRAVVKHKDQDGNTKEYVFEGNRKEIQDQIVNLKDMDEQTKQSLMQALDMNNQFPGQFLGRSPFQVPDWFNHPGFNHPGFRNNPYFPGY
jgi:hypothetical protein